MTYPFSEQSKHTAEWTQLILLLRTYTSLSHWPQTQFPPLRAATGFSPEIDLGSGSPMGIQGRFLLTLSLLVVAELIVLAALGPW